ncbi:MAG: disulfide bond formation protein B, partial [Parerythrobacter sp.]
MTARGADPRALCLAAAAGSALLLAAAYGFQLAGYAPCKMCLWQRWPHAVALGMAGGLLLLPVVAVAAAGLLATLTTAGIAAYHTGVERGWWEGPTSCSGGGAGLGGL